MGRSRCVAAAFLGLVLVVAAAAQEEKPSPISPDRPDFTNSSDTVEPGKLQWECGVSYAHTGDLKTTAVGEGTLRYGLSKAFELRFNTNSYRWTDVAGDHFAGMEDMAPGFKWKLYESKAHSLPSVAFENDTTIPTGASAYREDTLQPVQRFNLDWDLTERLGLGVNLGWGNLSDNGDRFTQYFASASFDITVKEPLHMGLELYTLMPSGHGGPNLSTADMTLSYRLNSDTAVDVHGAVALGGDKPNCLIGAGISFRW